MWSNGGAAVTSRRLHIIHSAHPHYTLCTPALYSPQYPHIHWHKSMGHRIYPPRIYSCETLCTHVHVPSPTYQAPNKGPRYMSLPLSAVTPSAVTPVALAWRSPGSVRTCLGPLCGPPAGPSVARRASLPRCHIVCDACILYYGVSYCYAVYSRHNVLHCIMTCPGVIAHLSVLRQVCSTMARLVFYCISYY